MDYTAVQRSGDFDDPRALGMYTKIGFIRDIPLRLIEAITDGLEGHPARSTAVFISSSGGAINPVAADATALPQRDVLGNMLCLVGWPHGDALLARRTIGGHTGRDIASRGGDGGAAAPAARGQTSSPA